MVKMILVRRVVLQGKVAMKLPLLPLLLAVGVKLAKRGAFLGQDQIVTTPMKSCLIEYLAS